MNGQFRGVSAFQRALLDRYDLGDSVIMEESSDGILLRPVGAASQKLSWENTAREIAESGEDWTDWDATLADGLDAIAREPGRKRRVADPSRGYRAPRPRQK